MATRRESCSRCRAQLVVPWEAQAVSCPVCWSIIRVRHNNGVNFFPPANYQYSHYGYYPSSDYGYYRQPFRPPVQVSPMSVHGRKRAVLCGISYRGHDNVFLKGSVNDVNSMKYFLAQRMGFPNESILVLTEDEKDPSQIPTKHNIRMALRWLVQGTQSGDSLVFHYSGHASKVRDFDGDELDGYDESLCPLDYETEGKILDDEINATIIRPLPSGAKLHAIIDTCYSGTILDLPFMCRMNWSVTYFVSHISNLLHLIIKHVLFKKVVESVLGAGASGIGQDSFGCVRDSFWCTTTAGTLRVCDCCFIVTDSLHNFENFGGFRR